MTEINKIARLDDERLKNFRQDLIATGERIRVIIDETPSSFDRGPPDMSLTKRIEWLQRQVLNPAERLWEALGAGAMFAQYPEQHTSALSDAERAALAEEINRLLAFAKDLIADFEGRSAFERVSHNTEMRREFCLWIAETIRCHVPNVPLARGAYDKEHGDRGGFSFLLRTVFTEITGEKDKLDQHLKEVIKLL